MFATASTTALATGSGLVESTSREGVIDIWNRLPGVETHAIHIDEDDTDTSDD